MSKSTKVGPVRISPQRIQGKETGKWVVIIPASLRPDGRMKRLFFENRKKALELARQIGREMSMPYLGASKNDRWSGVIFLTAVEAWVSEESDRVVARAKRASALETDQYRLANLLPHFGNFDLSQITKEAIRLYASKRLWGDEKYSKSLQSRSKIDPNTVGMDRKGSPKLLSSPSTVKGEVAVLLKVLRWCKTKGWLEVIPSPDPIRQRRRKVLLPTFEETVQILNHLSHKTLPLVWFLAESGCRPGEAYHLRWKNVDLQTGWVSIEAEDEDDYEDDEEEAWEPKTDGSERTIRIGGELLEMFRGLSKEGKYVFPHRFDPNRPRTSFRKALKGAIKRADLKRDGKPLNLKMTPKSFRKLVATWIARGGVRERVLQAWLGHVPGSKVTKEVYDQAERQDLDAASKVIKLPIKARPPSQPSKLKKAQ
ncbi:MAG: site-specific integrase [Magnetococcales bacterium]|nr:site-specific integrase [Magnetococcales bacterium]